MVKQHDSEYLTVQETMDYLGVSRDTLDRYVRLGKLQRYKRGLSGRTFYKRADLDNLLEIRPAERDEEK